MHLLSSRLLANHTATRLMVFAVVAAVMTLYEILKEVFARGDLSPWESHLITILFTASLATSVFAFFRARIDALNETRRAIQRREAEVTTHLAMTRALHHYMNNALNILAIVRIRQERDGQIDAVTMERVEAELRTIHEHIEELTALESPSADKIDAFLTKNI